MTKLPTKIRYFYIVSAILCVVAFGFFVKLSAGHPWSRRLVPWVLVWEALSKPGGLTGIEKFVMIGYVNSAAVLIVFFRRANRLAYYIAQLIFGVLTAWNALSFDLKGGRALNALILAGASLLVADALDGLYVQLGVLKKLDD